jgi:hypothetical protein
MSTDTLPVQDCDGPCFKGSYKPWPSVVVELNFSFTLLCLHFCSGIVAGLTSTFTASVVDKMQSALKAS